MKNIGIKITRYPGTMSVNELPEGFRSPCDNPLTSQKNDYAMFFSLKIT